MTQKIAIIGGGFSGVMVAINLLQKANHPLEIHLIERRNKLGEGIAYSTPSDHHLLNVPAGKMSAFGDQHDNFLQWLNINYPDQLITADTFVPRKFYSEYLRSILQDAEQKAQAGVLLYRVLDEAIAIDQTLNNLIITLKSGEQLFVDQSVLALGNFPPQNPAISNPSFYQSSRYVSWAWSEPQLPLKSIHEPLLLIGSGLTAIDIIATLKAQNHQGKIYVVSRRGLFPQPHAKVEPFPPFLTPESAPKTTRELVHRIREEIDKADQKGYNWRAVIDSLRVETQSIWNHLSPPEQARFLRHVQPYWDVVRHRIAPDVHQQIQELFNHQQLILYAGRILEYSENPDHVDVMIRQKHHQELLNLRVSLVINCTNSVGDYQKLSSPLLSNLFKSGLIRSDSLNLGLDVTKTGALIDQKGEISQQLYTLGTACKGHRWETTAVREIREQSENLATGLLN
ncbi:Beta-lactamase domain-containing protein [Planktothrix sp. PCC 11201]|uniref:FAD/NAD(P)-binding protein n=1 Tax=Planktothrix sp. PCC 11201 TaxID=1729650 RepID=UPI0009202168|nr:FAD/NAD(P)-binding protein [Planktothrix sp. PCC 11201]SKB12365.1 Beta-lactamase domain-containing protein [Planktothrix sp. PCC 11201]